MEMVNFGDIPFSIPLVLILMLMSTLLLTAAEKRRRVSKLRLPPGPARWPIVGNLMQLGLLPHKDMARFCSSYGPLVYLRLGAVDAITTDDPAVIREILIRQDNLFASRPKLVSAFQLSYGGRNIAFASMGPQWKRLRRTCVEHLLTARRFESFARNRALEVLHLMRDVREKACKGEIIEVSQVLGAFMMNNVTRMLLGRRYLGAGPDEAAELLDLTHQLFWLLGLVYPGDYLPLWRWLVDPFVGIEKKIREASRRMDGFLQRVIDEHRQAIEAKNLTDGEHGADRDFVDVLLSLPGVEEKERMDVREMKAIMSDIFTAASDTSAVASEWAMAEAIKNPKVLERAQEELDRVVGRDRMVRESDLGDLNYLRCIVRETFRMHPPAPLLVHHESTQATELMGYDIPAKTRVFINAHALGRNKRVWGDNADEFLPERHLLADEVRVEILRKGELEILPFGEGKRKCPGATMGTTMVLLALANLFHGFDWEAPEEIDMKEAFGLTLHKEKPLRAMARPRLAPSLFQ
ncbi:cytochrome P450 703A2-like [Curcuma longa]|uniref:cytochrome P450 703A2-like n=1 Tax=Curcuma longa TaxID=136217 RepID=UPI003D9E33F0